MIDDMEQLLGRLTPRGVGAELRPRVLAAVANELRAEPNGWGDSCTVAPGGGSATATPTTPWLRRSALAVAASLLVGIAMNLWASASAERRLAQLFGPPPLSKRAMEVAKAVEEITDPQTAQWVYQRLTTPRPTGDASAAYAEYCATVRQLIKELQTVPKSSEHG
jgi:hypothetical protein